MRNFLVPFGVLVLCVACLAQSHSNLQVSLSLSDEKAVYKVGEPILLRLTFSASVSASLNITTTDPASPVDRLVVSPTKGVCPWLEDQDHGHPYSPDYAAIARVDPGKSQIVELPLNAVYRFDAPGRYTVYVVTTRVQAGTPEKPERPDALTTNSVSFDIPTMTDEEEATRAASLEQRIREANSMSSAQRYAEELDWLTGDPSARVKLSLLLHPKEFYPFGVDVTKGLWIARNRAFVVEQLEKALQDPSQDLSAGSTLLQTAIALRARLNASANPNRPSEPLPMEEVENGYLKQIVASLPERSGASLLTAAQTVLTRLAARKDVSGPEFAAVREVVITHLAEVNEYNVDWLLNSFGTYLRDPRLTPVLMQILASQRDRALNLERTAVIRQLIKIAPQDSRTEVVNEVCGDNPTMIQYLGEVPFLTLPETDSCLQRKIHAALDARKPLPLQWATAFTTRFASAAIFDDLIALYQRSGTTWDKQAQGYMLAYLVRWNPQRGMPLLEAALPRTMSPPDSNITYALGRAGYIPAVDSFWRECLIGSPPELAAEAAYQMSEAGPNEDQALLRARLSDWRAQWKGREIPPSEGRFEGELAQAVMRGAHWQLSKDDMQSVASGCLSDTCRTRFASIAAR
jgi:hypothetical protein